MPRDTRVARRDRPAIQYMSIEDIIREEIASGASLAGVVAGLQARLVMVVRTDHEANRA